MYVLIFVLTVLVIRFAATKDCPKEEGHISIVINCKRQRLTDDDYMSTFLASLSGDDADEQSGIPIKNRDTIMLLESNEIRTVNILPNLHPIAKLSFKDNRIANVEKGAFQNLPTLKILDLGHNELTGPKLSDVFRGAAAGHEYKSLPLEDLNLGNNKIKSLNRDVFKYLPNLNTLTLNNNPINQINPDFEEAFVHLINLRVFSIAQTEISDLPDTLFKANPIEKLYLNGNHLSRVPKTLRNVARSLQLLNMNDNPIPEIEADSFPTQSNLMELHLSGLRTLKKIAPKSFSPLVNLKILVCNFNSKLEIIDSDAFDGLQAKSNLKEVFLNNNNLRYVSEQTVDWKKLNILRLDGNPWNCTCSLSWLLDFIRTRQKTDPEANLGMRCKYPAELKGSTLVRASVALQCSDGKTDDAVISTGFLKITTFIFCICIMIGLCILYYFLFNRIQRARRLRTRYSGTTVKSIIKYRRAQVDNTNEI